MQIEISKTNYDLLMNLIDKAVNVIKQSNPSTKDYNVARRLKQTKNVIIRQIDKQHGKQQQ